MCTALHKRNINSKWNEFTVVEIANYFKNELKDYYSVRRHAAFHKDFGKETVKGNTIKQFSKWQTQVKVHKIDHLQIQ